MKHHVKKQTQKLFSIIFKKKKKEIKMTLKKLKTRRWFFFLENTQNMILFTIDSMKFTQMWKEEKFVIEKIIYKWEMGKEGRSKLFSIFACQSALVEEFFFAACNQTWMTFSAEEETVGVSGNGKAWEWPEAGCHWFWINLGWALEADDGIGVALFEQEIGPVASVDSFVVDQTLGAGKLVGDSVFALDVAGGAFGAVFVDAEFVFTAGRWFSEWSVLWKFHTID